MVERSERFEIASRRDGRWAIEAVRIRMDESVALARELLARGAYEAVRVVRARDIADRTVFESVVFEAERDGDGEPPIRLAAADEQDCWCADLADFYGARSRRAMGLILRDFLDRTAITPTELLHHPRHARRLDDTGMLLSAAVQRVAQLGAQSGTRSLADSRRFLEAMIDEARRRAEASRADRAHPQPDPQTLEPFLEMIAARGGTPIDRHHAACHGIARSLEMAGSLLARTETVLTWGQTARTAPAIQAVDALLADCVASPTVLREMFGQPADLSTALAMAIAFARNRPADPPRRPASWYPALVAFMQGHPAAETRAILLDRVRRMLAGDRALTHGDASSEANALIDLSTRLADTRTGAFIGGTPMVEAMQRRWKRLDKPGGFGNLMIPQGKPEDRFRQILGQEGQIFGEMRQRAVATLLLDALRDIPVDERGKLNDLEPRIEVIGLLGPATRSVRREMRSNE